MLQIHRSVLLWGHFRADSDHNKKAYNHNYEAETIAKYHFAFKTQFKASKF